MKHETCQLWVGDNGSQCGVPIEESYNGFDADLCASHRLEYQSQFRKEDET